MAIAITATAATDSATAMRPGRPRIGRVRLAAQPQHFARQLALGGDALGLAQPARRDIRLDLAQLQPMMGRNRVDRIARRPR